MLSDTLTAGLRRYEIGSKVRDLRVKKKLGLVQLGEHTGLSPALLSKIERGQLFPTLPTLFRIAMVFGVGLDHFFIDNEDKPMVVVTRKKDRVRLPNRPGELTPSYFFESLDFALTDRKIDIFYAEFPESSTASDPHQHDGTEFLYVLGGRLVVIITGKDVLLDEGDTVHFDSSTPHSYRLGDQQRASSAIVVVMPEPR